MLRPWAGFWVGLILIACGSQDSSPQDPNGTQGDSTTHGDSTTPNGESQPSNSNESDEDNTAGPLADGPVTPLGEMHQGSFWLGPVDYAETEWHNACAPSVKYPRAIAESYGDYIMGVANEVSLNGLQASSGQLCDTCVRLEANGRSVIAHVVTYGQETGPDDIDVSPEIDAALNAEAGREASWQFVTCPTTEPIQYTFDGRQWDNTWFFRVWVRNSRVPVEKLEYRVGSGDWSTAEWQSDGAWQAASQDFAGGFALRVTAIDGQTLSDELPGLDTFDPDRGITSQSNFE